MMGFLGAKSSLRGALLAGCVLSLAGFHTAHAGFQWTAPAGGMANVPFTSTMPQTRPAELPPRTAAAPIAPVTSEALPASGALPNTMGDINAGSPVATTPDGPASAAPIYGSGMTNDPITWNPAHNSPTGTVLAAPRGPQNIMPAESVPLTPVASAPIIPAQGMQPVMASAGSGQYAVAEGFGRDLPLVMAIRQIVPAQYGFVFDQGIDVSGHVSWQGGQPWDIVLQNTLAPLGMTATINGNVISITRNAGLPQQNGMMPGVQMASITTPAAQVSSQTVQTTTTTTMTPVAMTGPQTVPGMSGDDTSMINPTASGVGRGYVSPVAATSTADLQATTTWTAARNSSLRNILEDWSQRVGVELYWASEYDYPIQSAVSINGTFEEAVQTLLKGLVESKPKPMGRLHPNLPNGPAVLVIETRQNSM